MDMRFLLLLEAPSTVQRLECFLQSQATKITSTKLDWHFPEWNFKSSIWKSRSSARVGAVEHSWPSEFGSDWEFRSSLLWFATGDSPCWPVSIPWTGLTILRASRSMFLKEINYLLHIFLSESIFFLWSLFIQKPSKKFPKRVFFQVVICWVRMELWRKNKDRKKENFPTNSQITA